MNLEKRRIHFNEYLYRENEPAEEFFMIIKGDFMIKKTVHIKPELDENKSKIKNLS